MLVKCTDVGATSWLCLAKDSQEPGSNTVQGTRHMSSTCTNGHIFDHFNAMHALMLRAKLHVMVIA